MAKRRGDTFDGVGDEKVERRMDPATPFDTAKGLIYGQREKDYGSPRVNMRRLSIMWTAAIRAKYPEFSALKLDENDCCLMLRLLKECRLMQDPSHADSIVDVMGYAGVQHRVNNDPQ